MKILQKSAQFLLAALTAASFGGACNKDATDRRVDEVKAEANDVKDRAEKRTEQAKEDLDRQLDRTKAAVDHRVDEVKAGAEHVKDDVRADVRGRDQVGPDATLWQKHWDAFSRTSDARWASDDDWIVERDGDVIRAHRRVYDPAVGGKMDDGAVTSAVKGRFATDDAVRPSNLDVDTNDGVVTLKGDVPTGRVAGEAIRVALATKGVRGVVSKLHVK